MPDLADRHLRIEASTTSLEAFAVLAGWSTQQCHSAGYVRWIEHVLNGGGIIYAIITFRRVTSLGLKEAKSFCESVAARPLPMVRDVSAALAGGSVDDAARILRENYTFGDREPATFFAIALAEAFGDGKPR